MASMNVLQGSLIQRGKLTPPPLASQMGAMHLRGKVVTTDIEMIFELSKVSAGNRKAIAICVGKFV